MQSQLAGPRRAAYTALSLAALTLPLAAPASAHDGPGARGVVQDVQLPTPERAYGVLTLTTRLGAVGFVVNADTKIEVEQHTATLADVHVGDGANVQYLVTTTAFIATQLEVERPRAELFGLVTNAVKDAVDPNVVAVTIDPPVGDPMTLKADADTAVSVGGHDGINLAALTPEQLAALQGSYAHAEYLVGTDQATELGFRKAGRLPFRGAVQGVDAAHNSLTVAADDQLLALVVVPGSTICRLNGKNFSLDALTPGDRCEGQFWMVQSSDGSVANVALVVKAQTPRPVEFTGQISALTPAPAPAATTAEGTGETGGGGGAGTVELTLRDGTTKVTVAVSSTTRIKVNGKLGTFADLQVGQKCHALCTPRPDGSGGTRYDCFRLEVQKLRPAGESRQH
jgi:hypothetical protein